MDALRGAEIQLSGSLEGLEDRSEDTSVVAGEVLARISTGLVQLHRRYYGKGPTKAKTYLIGDTVICMLKGGFTIAEQTLIDGGNVDAVLELRRDFQVVMGERFKAVVEGATNRTVTAYMSQIHHDPDLALELFVLEPVANPLVGEHEQVISPD